MLLHQQLQPAHLTETSVSDIEPATGLINAKSLTFNPKFGNVLKNVNSTDPISDLQVIYFVACLRITGVILSGVNTIHITILIDNDQNSKQ